MREGLVIGQVWSRAVKATCCAANVTRVATSGRAVDMVFVFVSILDALICFLFCHHIHTCLGLEKHYHQCQSLTLFQERLKQRQLGFSGLIFNRKVNYRNKDVIKLEC